MQVKARRLYLKIESYWTIEHKSNKWIIYKLKPLMMGEYIGQKSIFFKLKTYTYEVICMFYD